MKKGEKALFVAGVGSEDVLDLEKTEDTLKDIKTAGETRKEAVVFNSGKIKKQGEDKSLTKEKGNNFMAENEKSAAAAAEIDQKIGSLREDEKYLNSEIERITEEIGQEDDRTNRRTLKQELKAKQNSLKDLRSTVLTLESDKQKLSAPAEEDSDRRAVIEEEMKKIKEANDNNKYEKGDVTIESDEDRDAIQAWLDQKEEGGVDNAATKFLKLRIKNYEEAKAKKKEEGKAEPEGGAKEKAEEETEDDFEGKSEKKPGGTFVNYSIENIPPEILEKLKKAVDKEGKDSLLEKDIEDLENDKVDVIERIDQDTGEIYRIYSNRGKKEFIESREPEEKEQTEEKGENVSEDEVFEKLGKTKKKGTERVQEYIEAEDEFRPKEAREKKPWEMKSVETYITALEKDTGVKFRLDQTHVKELKEQINTIVAEKIAQLTEAFTDKHRSYLEQKYKSLNLDATGVYAVGNYQSYEKLAKSDEKIAEWLAKEIDGDKDLENLKALESDLDKNGSNLDMYSRGLLLSELNERDITYREKIDKLERDLENSPALPDAEKAKIEREMQTLTQKRNKLYETRTRLTEKIGVQDLDVQGYKRVENELIFELGVNADSYLERNWGRGEFTKADEQGYNDKWEKIISPEDVKILNEMGYMIRDAGKKGWFWSKKNVLEFVTTAGESGAKEEEEINAFLTEAKAKHIEMKEELEKEYNIEYAKIIKKGKDIFMKEIAVESGSDEIKKYYEVLKDRLVDEFIEEEIKKNKKGAEGAAEIESATGMDMVSLIEQAKKFKTTGDPEEDADIFYEFLGHSGLLRSDVGREQFGEFFGEFVKNPQNKINYKRAFNKPRSIVGMIIDIATGKQGIKSIKKIIK